MSPLYKHDDLFQVQFIAYPYFGAWLEDQKRFLIRVSTLHNGLHNEFGLYVLPIFIGFEFVIYRLFIVPYLKRINAVFAMLWPFQ